MFKVILKPYPGRNYVTYTLVSSDNSHYLNVFISEMEDQNIWVSIAKSLDGFTFKDTEGEIRDLSLKENMTFQETLEVVKIYLTNKGYKYDTIIKSEY